jgi:RNA polymerase sigma-70 factor (ECF subfamily)
MEGRVGQVCRRSYSLCEVVVDAESMELLVRLLTVHQDAIFRFIYSLHPHEEDARDILQETSVALCRKIEEYDPAESFLPWAFGFAYLEVMKQRERNQRGLRLLSDDVVERLSKQHEQHQPVLHARLRALDYCLEKLGADDRELVRLRYQSQRNIEELVKKSGSSRRTLFRNLDRIRRLLFDCISNRLASDDAE